MKIEMKNTLIAIYLFLISSLVFAEVGLRFESVEVKITSINFQNKTVSYIDKTVRKTLRIDSEVLYDGYFTSDVDSKKLSELKLNKKYFIRIAYNEYTDVNKKQVSDSYVSFISTVPYDTLY